MEDNKTGSILRITGVVTICVCVVMGIVLGNTNKMLVDVGLFSTKYEMSFNWPLMLSTWVIGFISGLLVYGIGEILRLMQILVNKLYDSKDDSAASSTIKKVVVESQPQQTLKHTWYCGQCHASNELSSNRCGKCDTPRPNA